MADATTIPALKSPVLWLVILAAPLGALDALLALGVPLLTAILFSTVSLTWCVQDAARRRRKLRSWLRVCVFLFPPVFVPVYLLWSRGLCGITAVLFAIVLGVAARLLGLTGEALIVMLAT